MFVKSEGIFVLLISLIYSEAARILGFFPTPSISHQVVFRPLMIELAKRGHEVTVVTPDPAYKNGSGPANLIEIDVHEISYKYWRENIVDIEKYDMSVQPRKFSELLSSVANLQLNTPQVQEILKKDKKYFDLMILEACVRVIMGFAHVFDAPVIQFSSFGILPVVYSMLGASMHIFLYPAPIAKRSYNLTLWEKGQIIYDYVTVGIELMAIEEPDYALMRRYFGQDVPVFDTLFEKVNLVLVNEHPIWSDNRPVTPNIIYVGGIHQTPKKDLPKDLQSILDSSKNGTIYVSFGTNVKPSSFPPEKILAIIKVLSSVPYDVLLKWDNNNLPISTKNIKISKWFPQADLLKHPNIKLFITQGGLQSSEEAIDAGVPVIGIPVLGDQWYNVEKYVHNGFGIQLDIESLTEDNFKNSILEVISNERYKQNVIRLRSLMRSRPVPPLDLAVWWTEHIIEHGGEHLKSPAVYMGFAEYYELKLIMIGLSILGILLILMYLIISKLLRYILYLLVGKSKTD